MREVEGILDRCLQEMEMGRSAEECLSRYPEWRDELAPLLKTASRLRSGAELKPSAALRQSMGIRIANLIAEEKGRPKERLGHARAEGQVVQRKPLLLYRRLAEYWGIPAVLLLFVSAGLLVWNAPTLQEMRLVLVLAFLLALGLLWTAFIMRRLTYVECGEDGLIIQLPFYRMRIPYESVTSTRPVVMHEVFPPSKQPSSTHRFLDPLWSKPAVVVQMRNWPQLRQQLRLWIDSRMIVQDGLVLMVEDHTDFRRAVQHAITQWRAGG